MSLFAPPERALEDELMDQPGLPAGEHDHALRGLARINRISRSTAILWPPLRDLARKTGRTIRVLDVASGAGDVPIGLSLRAARAKLPIEVHGCDISPRAIEFAIERARESGARGRVRFLQWDALDQGVPDGYDAVVTSLFLHHLDEDSAVWLLREMKRAAGSLVVVNDLIRTRLGYALAWTGCRLLTRSPVVHVDGPRSVRGAYTIPEALQLAADAGWDNAAVTRHWPERYRLLWRRP